MATPQFITFNSQISFERDVEHSPYSFLLAPLGTATLPTYSTLLPRGPQHCSWRQAQCRFADLQRTQGHYSQVKRLRRLRHDFDVETFLRTEHNGVHLFWLYEDEHRHANRTMECLLQRCLNHFKTTTSPHASCQKLLASAE